MLENVCHLFHSDAEIRAIVFSKSEEFLTYLNVEELA